jgi:ABC-2 type transport system ATP-binding protein
MELAIETQNLTKRFSGKEEILAVDNLNLQVKEGEIFGFLGPNGAGKTTTVNILATLLKPTSGKATVGGHDIVDEAMDIRRIIGYLPEDFGLYPTLTVYGNLDFMAGLYRIGKNERKEVIRELLEFLDLWDRRDSKGVTLSKGMK